jgi:uncharacterized protein (TIGR02118 family)
MVKVFALIPRKPDVTEEFFHQHWGTVHAELAKRITTISRYVQSHRVDPGVAGIEQAPYEGIAEVWFDDVATAAGMGEDPNYVNGAQADEPNFIDLDNLAFALTSEHVLVPGHPVEQDDPGVKAMLLLRRADGLSPEDFAAKVVEVSGRLADGAEGAFRVQLSVAVPESYADGAEPPCDAVFELWFDDASAPAGDVAGGLVSELDGIATATGFTADELRVTWPAEAVTA